MNKAKLKITDDWKAAILNELDNLHVATQRMAFALDRDLHEVACKIASVRGDFIRIAKVPKRLQEFKTRPATRLNEEIMQELAKAAGEDI